jgi:DNA polymerase-3 subunit beta
MDISITDRIKADVTDAGATTVPAHVLFDIVRKIENDSDVNLSQKKSDSSNVLLKVRTSEFTIPSLPIAEFPSFEINKATHKFNIHSEMLKVLLTKTRHAVSNDETRYYLNGIYMHATTSDDGIPVLRTVATDGHRLARAQTIQPEGCSDMPAIIIPKKTVGEIIKLLEDFAGDVEISVSQNKITFNIGTTVLNSKLIDGKFPDYDRVIPKNNDKTLEVPKESLARSIDLVISISNDKTRAVKFNIESSKIVVCATSELNGNAKGMQEIEAKFNSKEPISIGFNAKYVLDSLSAIDGNTVKVSLANNLSAVIAQDPQEVNCMYILMPMQV